MILEFSPYKPTSLGGRALELQVRLWDSLVPDLCYMGHTIWNGEFITALGRQPGLQNNHRTLHFDQEARSCFSKSSPEFLI